MNIRRVHTVVHALETREGAGFLVHRPFPTPALDVLDPFLLLDEMGPMDVRPGEGKGAPEHPHRGFETITYLLAGEMEHRDSHGNAGVLRPGSVQWMTAGSGVLHSEMPSEKFMREGGRMHGFQIWVNLPRARKMSAPAYQELAADAIPVARSADGKTSARVIAGSALGIAGNIAVTTPTAMVHFTLQPGGTIVQVVPADWNAMAYVIDGTVRVAEDGAALGRADLAVFVRGEGDVAVENVGSQAADVLFLAGKPLDEPVARYGPFVMNTTSELEEAFADYRAGRFASIDPQMQAL